MARAAVQLEIPKRRHEVRISQVGTALEACRGASRDSDDGTGGRVAGISVLLRTSTRGVVCTHSLWLEEV